MCCHGHSSWSFGVVQRPKGAPTSRALNPAHGHGPQMSNVLVTHGPQTTDHHFMYFEGPGTGLTSSCSKGGLYYMTMVFQSL